MADSLIFTTNKLVNTSSEKIIPIVFIHGWGLNAGVWQPLLVKLQQSLPSNYQLVTIDLPGFGQNNQFTIEPYTLENICQAISQSFQQPAIYLGWSLGGLVATQMALTFPEKVLALITVASSPCFVEQTTPDQQIWPGIKANILANFHQQLSQDTAKTINGFLKIQAMGSPHIRQDLKQITQLVMNQALPSKETLDESLALLENCDLRQQLTKISQPFLRLYGNNDSLVPKSVCTQVSALSPNSSQHIFTNASHAPFISHLDEFQQKLIDWLAVKF